MIERLYIENIAVIEKVEIIFKEGLNILTGETGSGKSIIIDSVNAILGNRTSKDLIRTGKKSAFVSATFTQLSPNIHSAMHQLGFAVDENGEILLQREIFSNGKSFVRINGRPAPVSILKEISPLLINIHGQHENHDLFSPNKHLHYLDKFADTSAELTEYQKHFNTLKGLKKKLDTLSYNDSEKARHIDLLQYQINEIEQAGLKIGEDEELIRKKQLCLHKEKISHAISNLKQAINGTDETDGALSLLQKASNDFNSLVELYPDATAIATRYESLTYELDACYSDIQALSDNTIDFYEDLDSIETRLALIASLSRKYGNSIPEILDFLEKAKLQLNSIEHTERETAKCIDDFNKTKAKVKLSAQILSAKRASSAKQFAHKIKEELLYLDMPKVEFTVLHQHRILDESGGDEVSFLASTNPGEQPRPISKIASGGELSRFMLAIKNVLSKKDDLTDTLIFDEIDSGISGNAAQKVGLKLQSLSLNKQTICVTHLPQIAVLADTHFLIEKNINDNRTFTNVKELDFKGRKNELARIIGGINITELTLKNAEEMLSLAKKQTK